jgi:hypothetical protein
MAARRWKNRRSSFRRFTGQRGQQGVDLSRVMGLVVEPMRRRRRKLLLEFLRR